MSMSDPREEMTEMIAAVLGELEPCRHVDHDGTCHRCAAAQVMELFRNVAKHYRDGIGSWTSLRLPFPAAVRYVLRTAPITGEDGSDG